MQLLHVGYNSIVNAEHVIAILSADSAPIKRSIAEARENGHLIDATYGRKTRSVLVMDSGHLVLSALMSETVSARAEGRIREPEEADVPEEAAEGPDEAPNDVRSNDPQVQSEEENIHE